jgi:hypothetical protein
VKVQQAARIGIAGKIKARGGGDAGTSLMISNTEIGWAFEPGSRNAYVPKGFWRIWVCEAAQPQEHLLWLGRLDDVPHRLRRAAALHLP